MSVSDPLYIERCQKAVDDLARELVNNFKEIKGISICGSLAVGNADEYSDIDVDIWLSDEDYKRWIEEDVLSGFFKEFNPYRETRANYSFLVGKDYKFDITILSTEKVEKEEWRVEQKANRSNSKIIYDPENIVRDLLEKKLALKSPDFINKEEYSSNDPNSEDYYQFYISAYLNYHVPVAVARGRFEQAHLNITWAMNLLIELLWRRFYRYYPYMKSRWFVIEKNLNNEERNLIRQVQLIIGYDKEDIKRRRAALREVYRRLGYKEIKFKHEKLDLS